MQRLWLSQVGWDDEIADTLKSEWQTVKTSLTLAAHIKIPRWIGYRRENRHVSYHGFCDASEEAYTAALYLRTVHENENVEVHLMTVKTKVTLTKKMSIPRLELTAAHLLAHLISKFKREIPIANMEFYAWTDSSATLAWISTPANLLKTFVANRVSQVQEQIPADRWRYVRSVYNPADCAKRCNTTSEIVSLTKWWNGPSFLMEPPDRWPVTPQHMITTKRVPEMRTTIMHSQGKEPIEGNNFLEAYSDLNKLLRMTAYCTRWLKTNRRFQGPAVTTTVELYQAKLRWIRIIQELHYPNEIKCLKRKQAVAAKSSLSNLSSRKTATCISILCKQTPNNHPIRRSLHQVNHWTRTQAHDACWPSTHAENNQR